MVNHLKLLIKENLKTFFSIMILTALGVGFLVGMKSTTPNLKHTVEKYYNDYNVMDLELKSSMGFTKDELTSFEKVKSIKKIEGNYQKDFIIQGKKEDFVLRIHSYNKEKDAINKLELISGSLPRNKNEMVIEESLLKNQDYKIGDSINIESDLLKESNLKIVGIIKSPYYLSNNKGSTNLLSGRVNYYAYISKDNIKSDLYSSISIAVKDRNKIENNIQEIKKIGKQVLETKYQKTITEYQEKIKKGKEEFQSKKLESENKIKEYENEIANAELLIESADESIPSIDEARQKLANKQNELNKVKQELDAAKSKIDSARNDYNTAKNEYDAAYQEMKQYENSTDPEEQLFYGMYQTAMYYAEKSLNTSREELEAKEKEYEVAYQEYVRVENTLNASSPEELIETAKREISSKKEQLKEKKKELEESKKRAEEQFITYENQLNDAEDYLKLISVNGWTIEKREDIPSFREYLSDIKRVEKIGDFFPILFYLVAVFITLTNITRIVTKDRDKIGLYKALGYSKKEIEKDYLLFSIISSIAGSLIGTIIGFYLIPRVFYSIYEIIYRLPKFQFEIEYSYILISFLLALFLVVISTYFSIKSTIKEYPAILLRPKEDKKGQRVFLEKTSLWKKLSFTSKVTTRNMFKYPKRFLMTILGISGCISLIVAGFNIRTSISNILPLQFEHIFDIDAEIFFKDSISRNTILEEKTRITNLEEVEASILSYVKTAYIKDIRTYLVIPEDNDLLLDFVLLEEKEKLIDLEDDGLIITKKLSETLHKKVGDTISLKDADNNIVKGKINHIINNYVDNYIYISKTYYKELTSIDPKFNTLLIRMNNKPYKEEDLSKKFNEKGNVSYLVYTSSSKIMYENLSKSLTYIVYILVISAVILAFVVLYNLNTLNVEERKREIATIKVLGFYKKETYHYIENEIKRLTFIGILIGIVFGYLFSNLLIKNCELDNLMYDYRIHVENYLLSIGITILFMIITSILGRKNIKKINMIESLKKVE